MKLLWLSHFVPFPPRGGNVQRSYNLIRQAARSREVHLLALNLHGEPQEKLREHDAALRSHCATVEFCELPYSWRGRRWWLGAAASPFANRAFSCRALFSPLALARWTSLLNAHPDGLVHIDSIDLALYADVTHSHRKVLNHHNCESAMAFRQAAKETNPIQRPYLKIQAAKLEAEERSLCASFDVNLAVSEQDQKLLQAIQPKGRYSVVANGVDTEFFQPAVTEPEPQSVIFTGMLGWGPNISAMDFLVRRVWPKVKVRFPGARLYLAGKNPAEHVLQWPKEDSSITVAPNPEDMRPWLARAAVSVCPILEGGGTRLKILDAMAMAKPVVSSTIGCEGLAVKHGENILVADAPDAFTAAIAELFDNAELARRVGTAGRALVECEYSWDRIGRQLKEAYSRVAETRDVERPIAKEHQGDSEPITR